MPQVMAARVTCPNCKNLFQTPIEQILDVKADPGAKMRVLNGLVNVAVCPQCKAGGSLGLPFLYHDPDKELALVYMPLEAGRDDMERQQAIGKLTSTVMDSLPPEERKAYLLQPDIFFTLENMVNKILTADGVTPEMIKAQKSMVELLQRMVEATSDEALTAMIEENDESINAEFLSMLGMNMEMVRATRQAADVQRLLNVYKKLLELSTEGQAAKARIETVETLRAEPTREKLVDLLIQAPDERTRELLILSGRSLLDYPFFQSLTSRIESAPDKNEKARLTTLRAEVLTVRDRIDEETRAMFKERAALLRDLLLSDDPETLARQRFGEMDQAFLSMLASNMEETQAEGDEEMFKSLQNIWNLTLYLMEETLPPEVRLLNQLVNTEEEAEVESLLQNNRALVTERMAQLLERMVSNAREDDTPEAVAERLALALKKVQGIIGETSSA